MIFTTNSGKTFDLSTVNFHSGSKTLQHPSKPMIFFKIPAGVSKDPFELKKVLAAKGVTLTF